jgi:hypothetical protein
MGQARSARLPADRVAFTVAGVSYRWGDAVLAAPFRRLVGG